MRLLGSTFLVLLGCSVAHVAFAQGPASVFRAGVSGKELQSSSLPISENMRPLDNYYYYDIGAHSKYGRIPFSPRHYNLVPSIPLTFGACTYTATNASVAFTINRCEGTTVTSGFCETYFDVFPAGAGPFSVTEVCDWITSTGNTGILSITWSGTAVTPQPAPVCTVKVSGSEISVDTQTFKEKIPIVGTEFDFVYSSRFAEGFPSDVFKLNHSSFNPEVFTFSVHNFYMPEDGVLFKGTGETEKKPAIQLPNGNLAVPSADGTEVYIFLSWGRHISTLHALTGAVKYSFDYAGGNFLKTITDAYGNVTTINRDVANRMTDIVAPRGQVTLIGPYSGDNISTVIAPGNNTYQMTYFEFELMQSFTKPGGQTTTFTYRNGKLVKDLGAGGNFSEIIGDRDIAAVPLTLKTAMGRSTVHSNLEFDSNGQYVRETVEPTGFTTTYREIPDGGAIVENPIEKLTTVKVNDERFGASYPRPSSQNLKIGQNEKTASYSQSVTYSPGSLPELFNYSSISQSTSINGKVTNRVFDRSTRTWTTTTPSGVVSSLVLDMNERPISINLGSDIPFTTVYDSAGRVSQTYQGSKNGFTYSYDSSGYLNQVNNLRNEVTSYSYDSSGRITTTTLPDGRQINWGYDSNGNVTSVTPPGRPAHSFGYNAMELPSSVTAPWLSNVWSNLTSMTYDLDRSLTKVTKPDGSIVDYGYSVTSGLLTSISSGTDFTSFTYFPASSLIESVTVNGATTGTQSKFEYYGRQIKSVEQIGLPSTFRYGKVEKAFDSEHRVAGRVVYGNGTIAVSNISITYDVDDRPVVVGNLGLTYDAVNGRLANSTLDRISDVRTFDQFGNLESYTASYDPIVGPPVALYSYTLVRDDMSRIVGKTETLNGVTTSFDYTFDSVGRLVEIQRNGSPYSEYVYDLNSNRTSGTISGREFESNFDDQDRMLSFNDRVYSYNSNGETTSIALNSLQNISFGYNGLGQLKSVNLPNGISLQYQYDASGNRIAAYKGGSSSIRFLYDTQNRPAAEVNDQGQVLKEYIYGSSAYSPDYMVYNGNRYFFVKDHLGSPRMVINSQTGAVIQKISYNEFGKILLDSNSCFQPFGFAGGLVDPDTNLVKFGARYYEPETGRWTSKDPILFNGGDTNLYGYVMNDPVNFIDPVGLWRWPWSIAEDAKYYAEETYPKSGHNGKGDALRHCIASCLMTSENGVLSSLIAGEFVEFQGDIKNSQPAAEKCMDRRNNAIGNYLGSNSAGSCVDSCIGAVEGGATQNVLGN